MRRLANSMNWAHPIASSYTGQQEILVASTGIEPARITRFELGHSAIRGNPRRDKLVRVTGIEPARIVRFKRSHSAIRGNPHPHGAGERN